MHHVGHTCEFRQPSCQSRLNLNQLEFHITRYNYSILSPHLREDGATMSVALVGAFCSG